MLIRNILLPGVVLPFAVSTVVWLSVRFARPKPPRGTSAVAVAAGFLAAFAAISGWPRWPPVEASQRVFFLVAVTALISAFTFGPRRDRIRLGTECLAIALLLVLVLQTPLVRTWNLWQAAAWLSGLLAVGFAATRALANHLDRKPNDLVSALVRLALLASVAAALGLSDSFRLALLTGGLAASVAAVEILSWRGRLENRSAEALVVTLSLGGLLLVGYFFAGLKTWPAVLLTIALLLLRVADSPSLWRRLLPLVPLVIALVVVVVGFLGRAEDPYDYYGLLEPAAPSATRTS